MVYLIDANIVITAHNNYYPVDAVPEFWGWLVHQALAGQIKMPLEVFEEVKDGSRDNARDLLFDWIQTRANRDALLLDEDVDETLVRQVLTVGYAPDLADDEVEQIGRDPFLIAYALSDTANRCVVTNEAPAPRKQRQNRRIPDVCASVGVTCCSAFEMMRALRFSTNWRAQT
jgi:hypothetical protein